MTLDADRRCSIVPSEREALGGEAIARHSPFAFCLYVKMPRTQQEGWSPTVMACLGGHDWANWAAGISQTLGRFCYVLANKLA